MVEKRHRRQLVVGEVERRVIRRQIADVCDGDVVVFLHLEGHSLAVGRCCRSRKCRCARCYLRGLYVGVGRVKLHFGLLFVFGIVFHLEVDAVGIVGGVGAANHVTLLYRIWSIRFRRLGLTRTSILLWLRLLRLLLTVVEIYLLILADIILAAGEYVADKRADALAAAVRLGRIDGAIERIVVATVVFLEYNLIVIIIVVVLGAGARRCVALLLFGVEFLSLGHRLCKGVGGLPSIFEVAMTAEVVAKDLHPTYGIFKGHHNDGSRTYQ